MTPRVSIIILNYNHPEVIDICLHTLAMTEGIDYEVVVVDNASADPDSLPNLRKYKEQGLLTTLVENPVNAYFSEGNNIGVRNSNPESEYILLLNSDVAFLRGDWLAQLVGWAEGTTKYWPSVWGLKPSEPRPGTRDIVSCGWSHDINVPGNARPEGWCLLIRRSLWRDCSPDFPMNNGLEEMLGGVIRDGAKCGVLCMYANYLVHRELGSKDPGHVEPPADRLPDIAGWFADTDIESIDFTLGRDEHSSYLCW